MIDNFLIFLLAFLITYFTYIIIFRIKSDENINRSKYNFNTLGISLSMAVVITIMMNLIDTNFGFSTIFIFVTLALIEYNIFVPMLFGKELLDSFKKESMLAVVISKGLIFIYLFFISF